MAETTLIEWTQATWNPWMGCTVVSPGCAHCYMFREQRQYGRNPEVVVRSKTKFRDPLKWKDPRLIFTCSWSDWFHEDADQWRDEAWEIIRQTPHHTYQILTKRPERMAGRLPWGDFGDPWPNVWLGVSIENQRFAGRADLLATVPATVRFISAEPLLGLLDLRSQLGYWTKDPCENHRGGFDIDCVVCTGKNSRRVNRIHWVIAGGESGPKARPCELVWLRSLRDQCLDAGVPFFLKQLGGWPDKRGGEKSLLDGERWSEMPAR